MSRRMIYTLSVVMAIAAASLIGIQMMTIKQMSDLQNQNFSAQANKALYDVTETINFREYSIFFNNDAEQSDFPDNSSGIYPNTNPNLPLSVLEERGEISVKSSVTNGKGKIIAQSSFFSHMQTPSFQAGYNRKRAQDAQTLRLQIYLKGRSELPLPLRISPNILAAVLDTSIRRNNIQLDYKFTIRTQIDTKNKNIMGSDDYNPSEKDHVYKVLLFPGDDPIKPD